MTDQAPAREIDALIAASAHDAKNALGVVLERLDELADRLGDDALQREVGDIGRQLGRVGGALARILTLYKMGADKYPLDLVKQPVAEVIEEAVLVYRSAFAARGLQVEVDCPAGLMACFDAGLVGGVVADALHNASRYARSRIHIACSAQGKGAVIQIEDDGPGIGAEDADTAGDSPGSGRGYATGTSGLGMGFAALVARLHRHGGERGSAILDNASRHGGARWAITLP